MANDEKKRGPGRPPGPCSPQELEQRRGAAHKTGQYAATAMRRSYPPCSEKHCPLEFPCEVRQAADAEGTVLSRCVVEMATSDQVVEDVLDGIRTGDLSAIEEMQARCFARLSRFEEKEGSRLEREGFTAKKPLFAKDGTHLGDVPIIDPAVPFYLETAKMMGVEAKQLGITRTSAAKAQRDKSIADHFDWMNEMRLRIEDET